MASASRTRATVFPKTRSIVATTVLSPSVGDSSMNLDEQVSRKQLRLLYLIKSDQRLTQLWNTYLDNLLGLLDNEESIRDFAAYADDLCILINGNSRRELEIKANTAVRKIHNWCQRYNMTMSPTKTMAIVFGKILKRKPIIKLGTTTLPVKEDTRYLGVILDQKLNFSKHINVSLEKARAQLNKILTLANRKYNIPPRKFKKSSNCPESSPPEDVQGVLNNISGKLANSHRHATTRFANCNKGNENTARHRS
ncbi:hypothetical protein HN011_003728 [Eciton burchellii]|nr:hypothetical protein HN011_003728 [Eciton burchellii]